MKRSKHISTQLFPCVYSEVGVGEDLVDRIHGVSLVMGSKYERTDWHPCGAAEQAVLSHRVER